MNFSRFSLSGVFLLATLAFAAMPDVKYTQVTTIKFHGGLGTMMKLAGASGPQTSTNMVSGNKQRSDNGDRSTIIDLDREVMITVDHKKKEYTEMTFAEWREMLSRLQGMGKGETADKPEGEKVEWKFDVKVDRTGERQTINGYACEKVILTMKAEGEKKPEAGSSEGGGKGGMVITSTQWMTPQVAGWDEAQNFGKKFAEKLGMSSGGGAGALVENMMKSNPQLSAAFKRLAEEGKKLNGVAVKTESVFETWGEQTGQAMENQPEEEKPPSSVGGLLGGLGKKMAKKPASQGSGEAGRQPIFESSMTLQSVSAAALDASLFAAPATYKKKAK